MVTDEQRMDDLVAENNAMQEAVIQSNIRLTAMLELIARHDKRYADACVDIIKLQEIQLAAQQMLGVFDKLLELQRGHTGIYIEEDQIKEHLTRWRKALNDI